MILLVFAMESEASLLITKLNKIAEYPFLVYLGKISNKDVALVISGIGKTNAASALTYALIQFPKTQIVLNAGIVGGYKVFRYQTYLVEQASYHDVDVTAFNYEKGQIPKFPTWYQSEVSIIKHLTMIPKVKLFTGDEFQIKPIIDQPYIVDMEGAAIFQVAFRFKKPVFSLKVVSDLIGTDNQVDEFHDAVKELDKTLAEAIIKALEVIS